MTEPTQPDREPAAAPPPPPTPAVESPSSGPAEALPPDASPDAALAEMAQAEVAQAPQSAEALPPDAAVAPVAVEPVQPGPSVVAADAAEASPTTPAPAPGRRPATILGYLGAAFLGIVIGAGALALATGRVGSASPTPSPTPAPSEAPAGNAIGRPDAPVTIEVWADYQCPFCRLEDLLFGGALEREYVTPGVARIVFRDFAFLGQESTGAAIAARCAGRQEPAAQRRYHDALYAFQQGENQGRFVRKNLVQIAGIAGVPDAKAFEACLDDPAIAQAVAAETDAGRKVGVSSTPTMRLLGPGGERVLTGFSQAWPPLRDAIESVRVPGASPVPGGSAAPSSGSPATSGPPVTAQPGSPAPSSTPSPAPGGTPKP